MRTTARILGAVFLVWTALLAVVVWKYGFHLNYSPHASPAVSVQARNLQTEKNLWWICTPDGWKQIATSAPVHIWGALDTPGVHPLAPGRYVLGPFSPAQTFTGKWGKYPVKVCGPERTS